MTKYNKMYSLEYEYKLYLKQLGITEEQLHPEQSKQIYQFFFAGSRAGLRVFNKIAMIQDKAVSKYLYDSLLKEANETD